MAGEFQFADIIVLGLIAVFILLRLRSNLGRRVGFDKRETPKKNQRESAEERVILLPDRKESAAAEAQEKEESLLLAKIENPEITAGLAAIKTADPSFQAKSFLDGAKAAFEMVFTSFAKGEKPVLKNLLSEDIYNHFASEIESRNAAEEKQEATLVAILDQEIIEASLEKNLAHVTVRFKSEQIHVLRNKKREIIGGDASAIETIEDEWTFERDTRSRNPNWKIIAT